MTAEIMPWKACVSDKRNSVDLVAFVVGAALVIDW
jgi:hypothetical protein